MRRDFETPLTRVELKFLEQFIFETMKLLPMDKAPARRWLHERQLVAHRVMAPFSMAYNEKSGIRSLIELSEFPGERLSDEELVIPWSGREEFLVRKGEIEAWLAEQRQHEGETDER